MELRIGINWKIYPTETPCKEQHHVGLRKRPAFLTQRNCDLEIG